MYETGVAVSVLISLVTLVVHLAMKWSALGRNLARVGLRPSLFFSNPVPIEGSTVVMRILATMSWVLLSAVSAALSWLGVAWMVGNFLLARFKDIGAPRQVRDLRWKMRNLDMSKEQLEHEMQKTQESLLEP